MNLTVITPPEEEPISVATAKAHLRVDYSTDDALIGTYLKAARELCEGLARRAFVTQSYRLVFDDFPSNQLRLPRPPLQSVEAVTYLDADGNEHDWTDYTVDTGSHPGRIIFNSLPNASLQESGAVAIEFTAGYESATDMPTLFVMAILQTVANWYENREMGDVPKSAKLLLMSDRGGWF